MSDPYHHIYQGEIFQQSQCIWHENSMMDFFRSQLINLGYTSVSNNNKTWQRGQHKVIVCLADDVITCRSRSYFDMTDLFDSDTVIITDNRIACPTMYTVSQLPASYFGIYYYRPHNHTWSPQRRFTFGVNRLDFKRLLLMLELAKRSADLPNATTVDHVNFNCWSWNGDNSTDQGRQQNFLRQFEELSEDLQTIYKDTAQVLLPQMPLLNHQLELEQAHVSSWLNIVVETYSSDTTVALSEKLFRALVTPVPWVVYSGRHTVAYLRSLGFDVMSDIVNHEYDSSQENNSAQCGDKMVDFVYNAKRIVNQLQQMQFDKLAQRCAKAASHNQQLLQTMSRQWPSDFAAWWAKTVDLIK